MEAFPWWLAAPIIFLLPGWYPAQRVTGRRFGAWTAAWALLFSVVLVPPIGFGVAMALRTTLNTALLLVLSIALGSPSLWTIYSEWRGRHAGARVV